LCHHTPEKSALPCFTMVSPSQASSRSEILTLSFAPELAHEFADALKTRAKFAADTYGVKFHVEGRQVETIGEMKSGKWMAYAAQALVMRFWELAKVRPPACDTRSDADMRSRKQTPWIYFLYSPVMSSCTPPSSASSFPPVVLAPISGLAPRFLPMAFSLSWSRCRSLTTSRSRSTLSA